MKNILCFIGSMRGGGCPAADVRIDQGACGARSSGDFADILTRESICSSDRGRMGGGISEKPCGKVGMVISVLAEAT